MSDEVHGHSLVIQFMDRVYDPGMAREWHDFWKIYDYRRALKGREILPVDIRLRMVRNSNHVDAMEFFNIEPEGGMNEYE